MYKATLRVYEKSLNGDFVDTPHTYVAHAEDIDTVKTMSDDMFWQCVEIEGIGSGLVYTELDIEKDGEYVDSDNAILDIDVIRTDKPSSYSWSPSILAVNRRKSKSTLLLGTL